MRLYFLLALCVIAKYADGVMFHLSPNTQKCLQEDIQANQLVMGEYEVSDVPGQVIDYIVSIAMFAIATNAQDGFDDILIITGA